MSTSNGGEGFLADFERVSPLICEEWPGVDSAALTATAGDYEGVVSLIAGTTEHTRARVRQQLTELAALARAANHGEVKVRVLVNSDVKVDVDVKLQEIARKLEQRFDGITRALRSRLADAEKRVVERPYTTLIAALGLGMIVGLLFGGRRR